MPVFCCISQTETCFKFCVTCFSKRNNPGVRRDEGENLLVMCKGGMEKGNDGFVLRRQGTARIETKHCRSQLV